LFSSYERQVIGDFEFYLIVPSADVAAFQHIFKAAADSGKIRHEPNVLPEEEILSAAGVTASDISNMGGWEIQQIVKLGFAYTNLSKYYVTLDSATMFARKFDPLAIFMDGSGLSRTYAVRTSRQSRAEQYAGEKGWLNGVLSDLVVAFDEIDAIMENSSDVTHFYNHSFNCFSSLAIRDMMLFLKHKNFAKISDIIKFMPYEFTWYGAYMFSQKAAVFIPLQDILKPILSDEDLQSIKLIRLADSPFFGFLFQPPVVDRYEPVEIENIVLSSAEAFCIA